MKPIAVVVARALATLVLLLALPAWADPPARVGRLADVAGQVWIYDEHEGEWIAAARNRPITSGDRLATEAGARAEVQVGRVAFRLGADTELDVLQLDDDAIRLQLHGGSVALRARSRDAARELELLTGEGRFAPRRAGHYRVDRIDDLSAATVWSGLLNFRADDSELDLQPGERAEFWSEAGRTHYARAEPVRDDFADWVLAEDARESARSASSQYASPEMPGIDELDRHGRWQRSDEYGALWVPYRVAPGWAPYRYGHWAYVAPWGWSWVDDAPWGFAPFHYGRWVHFGGHWAWSPGVYAARPVYAPALVAWVGGPQVSVSVNIGGRRPPAVGWFPLGPREVYVPTYRVSPVYIRRVNGGHVRDVDPVIIRQPTMAAQQTAYVNRHVADAVTVVAPDVIRQRRPVAPHLDVDAVRALAGAPVSVSLPVAGLAGRGGGTITSTAPPPPHRADGRTRLPRVHAPLPATPRPALTESTARPAWTESTRGPRGPVEREAGIVSTTPALPTLRRVPAPVEPAQALPPPGAVRPQSVPIMPQRPVGGERPSAPARPLPPAAAVLRPAPPAALPQAPRGAVVPQAVVPQVVVPQAVVPQAVVPQAVVPQRPVSPVAPRVIDRPAPLRGAIEREGSPRGGNPRREREQ